jgi:putative spermidine/putrescine transport system substrate-binding protein
MSNKRNAKADFPVGASRRRFLQQGGALGAASLLLPASVLAQKAGSLAGKQIVFVSWGGVYQDSQKASFCDPLVQESGLKILQDGPMNEAKLRTMVQGGHPDWNVCDVTDAFLFNGITNKLFEPVDYAVVDKSQVLPQYVNDYGVGDCVWSYNVAYNTKTFGADNHPKTWADLFDLKRFPGKRAFRDRVYSVLEVALLADGVDPKKLYPLDVDRAFRKLDTIKDQITWWTTPSQSQALFVDGAVGCGMIQNGRAYDANKKGAPIAISWEQNLQSVDYLVMLRGSRDKAASMQLLNRAVQVDAQAKFANLTAYSPVNPKAFALIDKSIAPWLSTEADNVARGVLMDASWWDSRFEKLTERWNTWKLS